MGDPHRITLDCTAEGYVWIVYDKGGKELGAYEMKRENHGFRGTERAETFQEDVKHYPEILEAIDGDAAFTGMHISDALAGCAEPHYPFEYDEDDFHHIDENGDGP